MKKFALVFFTLSICIGINLPEGVLASYGIDQNILMMAMIAYLIPGLVRHTNIALIVLILGLAIAVNVPFEFAESVGYDPKLMLVALIALTILPLTVRQI